MAQWYKIGFPCTRPGFESRRGEDPFASVPLYVPLAAFLYYWPQLQSIILIKNHLKKNLYVLIVWHVNKWNHLNCIETPSDSNPGNPAGKPTNLIFSRWSWRETRESYSFSVILAGNLGIFYCLVTFLRILGILIFSGKLVGNRECQLFQWSRQEDRV